MSLRPRRMLALVAASIGLLGAGVAAPTTTQPQPSPGMDERYHVLCSDLDHLGMHRTIADYRKPQIASLDVQNMMWDDIEWVRGVSWSFQVWNGRARCSDHMAFVVKEHTVLGDIGGADAQPELIVETAYWPGGTGIFNELWIFTASGQRIRSGISGDRAQGGVASFAIDNGTLVIVQTDGRGACCATEAFRRRYRLVDNELVPSGVDEPLSVPEPVARSGPWR